MNQNMCAFHPEEIILENFSMADHWGRKMCDWTIGNQSYTAKDGNKIKHGNNHSVQLPSIQIWNTTVSGKLVRLHGPIKSYFVVRQNSSVA